MWYHKPTAMIVFCTQFLILRHPKSLCHVVQLIIKSYHLHQKPVPDTKRYCDLLMRRHLGSEWRVFEKRNFGLSTVSEGPEYNGNG